MEPLSQAALERAMRSAGIDAPGRYRPVIDSTNAAALAWASQGAPEWSVVAAGHQTAGRGRLGRRWESEPGGSLLFSMVVRPALPPDRVGLLALLAGVAMAESTRDAGGPALTCKWPNDLLRDHRKVGGILLEASTQGGAIQNVVVGVGVNLTDPPPGLAGAAGLDGVEPELVLTAFIHGFVEALRLPQERFASDVLRRYRPLSSTIGRRVRARTTDGGAVEGTADDVDEAGNLVVVTDGGRTVVGFGEVEHLE
jgi:BirA family transcriptional regulator, biotin operon repressor / biotin---[acetyl-CoA-carboxylase] ligase